eukprot:3415081-Rhodomonas_salina.2
MLEKLSGARVECRREVGVSCRAEGGAAGSRGGGQGCLWVSAAIHILPEHVTSEEAFRGLKRVDRT